MKNLNKTVIAFIVLAITLTSCKKENDLVNQSLIVVESEYLISDGLNLSTGQIELLDIDNKKIKYKVKECGGKKYLTFYSNVQIGQSFKFSVLFLNGKKRELSIDNITQATYIINLERIGVSFHYYPSIKEIKEFYSNLNDIPCPITLK